MTSSADVSTARTPVPRSPHASTTARRLSCQWPGPVLALPAPALAWPAAGLPWCQCALDLSTQRISPPPGGSLRSFDRSVKYSRSPGWKASGAPRTASPGTGNLSSGSGHAQACAGSAIAACTWAASAASRCPQRSPTTANGWRSSASRSVTSYAWPARSRHGTAATLRSEPSTQRSTPITER